MTIYPRRASGLIVCGMSTPRTDAKIARLEARQTALDAALAAFAGGIEEYQVDNTRYRKAQMGMLEAERRRIDGELSLLYKLKDSGTGVTVYRGTL